MRVTYRFSGGNRTAVNDASKMLAAATTVTVDSTAGFPLRGQFLIEDEYVIYSGKTATTFTGLTRGAYNTTDAEHADDTSMTSTPGDIEEAITKMVALDLYNTDDCSPIIAEGADGIPFDMKVSNWKRDIRDIIKHRKELYGVNP